MNQEKTIMSNSYRKAGARKQFKEFMKQCGKENNEYEIRNSLIIEGLRNSPRVHDFNQMDTY